jgi:hypothetical protein
MRSLTYLPHAAPSAASVPGYRGSKLIRTPTFKRYGNFIQLCWKQIEDPIRTESVSSLYTSNQLGAEMAINFQVDAVVLAEVWHSHDDWVECGR